MKNAKFLNVYIAGKFAGKLYKSNKNLSFQYSNTYLNENPITLSYSMPLTNVRYPNSAIEPFVRGLFSENKQTIDAICSKYEVSIADYFEILSHIGCDCAGAVKFVPEDYLENETINLIRLTDRDLSQLINGLVKNEVNKIPFEDAGKFSLAGAQSKTSLTKVNNQWFQSNGHVPTTHIIKVPLSGYAYHVENEVYTQRLAGNLGLTSCPVEILEVDGIRAIAIERYDRSHNNGEIIRIHQEDMCQALSKTPDQKYQKHNGLSIPDIMNLLKSSTNPLGDQTRFIEAIIFNYLIIGTDAHAKNYSILHGYNNEQTLAPLYDMASYLPYFDQRKELNFAMKVGDYRDDKILPHHFNKLAKSCDYSFDKLVSIFNNLASSIVYFAHHTKTELELLDKMPCPIYDTLIDKIDHRINYLKDRFKGTKFKF